MAFFPVQAKVSIMDKEAWERILRRVRRSAGLVKRRTIAVLRRRRRECQRVHIFIDFLIIYWARSMKIKCSLFIFQVFEDAEFHQMEEEARKEAEKEELAKEIR